MKHLNNVLFYSFLTIVSIGCGTQKESNEEVSEAAPNVIFIFPDQFRRYSMGFWSEPKYREHVVGAPDPVHTPNLDKLAKQGVVFTQAVSNFPLCSPYRAMMMSGRYPDKNGVWNNCRQDRDDNLRDDVKCLTDVFYDAGYNTSYFGKVHWAKNEPLFDENATYVGTTEKPGGNYINAYDTYIPQGKARHSIEYFYQGIKDQHFDPLVYSNDPKTIDGKKDGEQHRPKKYTPESESMHINNYLKNTHGQRDQSKPFCMVWSLNPPHNPWTINTCHHESFDKFYSPEKVDNLSDLYKRENADIEGDSNKYAPFYFANVTGVDKYIGEVLSTLEELGLSENTIIVFSTDHGEMLSSHGRSGKNQIEMESFGIPFMITWPKKLKHRMEDMLFNVPDVMPTLVSLAGIKPPDGIEGTDFSASLINNQDNTVSPHSSSIYYNTKNRGVYTGQYSMRFDETGDFNDLETSFIYDNYTDPYQLNKISLEANPELTNKLINEMAYWLVKTEDPWFKEKMHADKIPYNAFRL